MLGLLFQGLVMSDKYYLFRERSNGHINHNVRTKFVHSDSYHLKSTIYYFLIEENGETMKQILQCNKSIQETFMLGILTIND